MRPLRYIFTTPLLAMASATMAQTSAVVFDMETRRQIEGAKVYVNPHGETTTDKQGRFTIEGDFHSLTVAGKGYESRSMAREELPDTVWLLPNGRRLGEVVVIGHKPKISFTLDKATGNLRKSTKSGGSLGSFDFFDSFQFKKMKQKKRRKKIKKILDDY